MPDKKPTLIDIKLCPTKVAAEVFGCSGQHLRDLVKAGEITQTGRGKYDLADIARYKAQSNAADMSDLQKAKLKSEQEKARRQKLQNDEADNYLIRSEQVADFLNGYTGEWIKFYESAKKSTGAELDNETRKKFFKKLDDGRAALARKLKAWIDDSMEVDRAERETDA